MKNSFRAFDSILRVLSIENRRRERASADSDWLDNNRACGICCCPSIGAVRIQRVPLLIGNAQSCGNEPAERGGLEEADHAAASSAPKTKRTQDEKNACSSIRMCRQQEGASVPLAEDEPDASDIVREKAKTSGRRDGRRRASHWRPAARYMCIESTKERRRRTREASSSLISPFFKCSPRPFMSAISRLPFKHSSKTIFRAHLFFLAFVVRLHRSAYVQNPAV